MSKRKLEDVTDIGDVPNQPNSFDFQIETSEPQKLRNESL